MPLFLIIFINAAGFNLSSYRSCKNLWKSAVEHHSFFRLQSPKTAGRKFSLLGLSSKFRYSGRTEFQTVSETALANSQAKSRWERAFFRSPSRRVLRQTMPNLDKSRNILASPEHSSIGIAFNYSLIRFLECQMFSGSSIISNALSNGHLKPAAENVKPNSGSRVSLAVRAYESFNNRVQSLGVRSPRKAWGDESDDEGGFLASTIPRLRSHAPSLPPGIPSTGPPSSSPSTRTRSPTDLSKPPALFSFADDSSSERGSETPSQLPVRASSEPPSQASTVRLTSPDPSRDTITASPDTVQDEACSGVVTVTINPDTQGRFGFNVKGGADQGVPVIVSRVAVGTPADKCVPRLNEGDQVVVINGREVSTMTHDQVVNFIRAAREPHSGQLVLSVRQVRTGSHVTADTGLCYRELGLTCSPQSARDDRRQRGLALSVIGTCTQPVTRMNRSHSEYAATILNCLSVGLMEIKCNLHTFEQQHFKHSKRFTMNKSVSK